MYLKLFLGSPIFILNAFWARIHPGFSLSQDPTWIQPVAGSSLDSACAIQPVPRSSLDPACAKIQPGFSLSQDPGNLTAGSLETIFLKKGSAILWRPILCREGALLIFVVQSPTPALTVGFLCREASYCAPASIDM